MTTALILDLARAGLVVLASVILGMALYVVVRYGQRVRHGDARALPKHIATVAFSYSLLVILTAGTQLELLVTGAPVSWHLPVVLVAYAVGAWSLRLVLVAVNRRDVTPRRRASDPG